MSDNTNSPSPADAGTPDAGAGAPATPQTTPAANTPDGGETQQPGQPFAVFPTADAFNARLVREARKMMDEHAKTAGFDNWQAFMETRTTPPTETPPASAAPESAPEPETPPAAETPATPAPPDEAARLRMALAVATEKGLPPALIARLQGNTPEEMAADADTLLGLVQRPPSGPGIPPTRQNGQTVTYTRAQLRDPAFVREHAADIQRAAREGRIADS